MTETKARVEPRKEPQANIPDPDNDPAGYLLAKGWKPQGPARNRWTKWLDPTKPTEAKTEEVEVGRVKRKDGKEEITKQTRITPAAWPMDRDQALATQMERDQKAELA